MMVISEETLKKSFRAVELKNRVSRNAAIAKNIAALANEDIPEADKTICDEALYLVTNEQERFARLQAKVKLGYWSRLWWALKGGGFL